MDSDVLAAHARCQPHAQRLHFGPTPEGVETVACLPFLDAEVARSAVRAFAARLGASDLRAAASVWSKHYVGTLAPGIVALMTLEGLGIDARAAHVRLEMRDDRPHAAWIEAPAVVALAGRSRGTPASATPAADDAQLRALTLGPLLEEHLASLFRALQEGCGVRAEILWNNVGNSLAWYYDRFALDRPEAARADRAALLEAQTSPMRNPVTYEELAPHGLDRRVQVRTLCCLRYRLPDMDACYTCPRVSSAQRARLVRKAEGA